MASHKQPQPLGAGAQAPEFRLDRLGGGSVTLSEMVGRGDVLLAFFKISCPVCQLTLPFLERLSAGSLPVFGICQDGDDDAREFATEFGISFPLLLDREENDFPASNNFRIGHVPTMFLVTSTGTIARVIEGWSKRDLIWLGARPGVELIGPEDRVPELRPG